MRELRIVRRGRRRLIPVGELQAGSTRPPRVLWGNDDPQPSADMPGSRYVMPGAARRGGGPVTARRRSARRSAASATRARSRRPSPRSRREGLAPGRLDDLRRGKLRAPQTDDAARGREQWLRDAAAGTVLNRSGDATSLGAARLRAGAADASSRTSAQCSSATAAPRRPGGRCRADRIGSKSPSTVRNALLPLRAICRRALARGEIHDNPTRGLELPAVRGRPRPGRRADARRRPCSAPSRLDRAAVGDGDLRGAPARRAAGPALVRRRPRRGRDPRPSQLGPRRGRDRAEVARRRADRADPGAAPPLPSTSDRRRKRRFVFGRAPTGRSSPGPSPSARAEAWSAAGLNPITLHECRHTYASLMIAAGVNAKALQTFMGHASITHHDGPLREAVPRLRRRSCRPPQRLS